MSLYFFPRVIKHFKNNVSHHKYVPFDLLPGHSSPKVQNFKIWGHIEATEKIVAQNFRQIFI